MVGRPLCGMRCESPDLHLNRIPSAYPSCSVISGSSVPSITTSSGGHATPRRPIGVAQVIGLKAMFMRWWLEIRLRTGQ